MRDFHDDERRAAIRRIHREQLERETGESLPARVLISALFAAALALGIGLACL